MLCFPPLFSVSRNISASERREDHVGVSPALATVKVTHFQRNVYWKHCCMFSVMSHTTSQQVSLCSKFNSVCKVKQVTGQSVAHLHRHMLLSPETERYCSLLTAVWHCGWNGALIKVYFTYEHANSLKWRVILFSVSHRKFVDHRLLCSPEQV